MIALVLTSAPRWTLASERPRALHHGTDCRRVHAGFAAASKVSWLQFGPPGGGPARRRRPSAHRQDRPSAAADATGSFPAGFGAMRPPAGPAVQREERG